MVVDHKKDADEISTQRQQRNESGLEDLGFENLPIVREHLQLAQDITTKIGGQIK